VIADTKLGPLSACRKRKCLCRERTCDFRHLQISLRAKDLRVTADGTRVVSHVGAALLQIPADRAGLTRSLSAALARGGAGGRFTIGAGCWSTWRVMIADGGEAICDIDVLRHQAHAWPEPGLPRPRWRRHRAITP
jgi:hypothetical protein